MNKVFLAFIFLFLQSFQCQYTCPDPNSRPNYIVFNVTTRGGGINMNYKPLPYPGRINHGCFFLDSSSKKDVTVSYNLDMLNKPPRNFNYTPLCYSNHAPIVSKFTLVPNYSCMAFMPWCSYNPPISYAILFSVAGSESNSIQLFINCA